MSGNKSVNFRLEGLTCAGCAEQFERSVREIPGVEEARVDFASSRLTVVGQVSSEVLEKAGDAEGIRVLPETAPVPSRIPFWKRQGVVRTTLAALLAVIAWTAGEGSVFSMLGYVAAMLVGGLALFRKGCRQLFRLRFDMNALMTVAIIGAAAIGEWSEAATVVILFAVSESLESWSMDRARRSIRSLMELSPERAVVEEGGEERTVHVREVKPGDILIVKPGQKVPLDGIVAEGASSVNQAAITGESVPVDKSVGDEVYAGTLNGEGFLKVRATKPAEASTISRIVQLVEEARSARAPVQSFIERFARKYTPVILVVALLTATVPPWFGVGGWSEWVYRGLALLVVACPCALVISTPVAVVTALGSAARRGLLIKGGIHLEQAASLSVIAFDKTGTLTAGHPEVTRFVALAGEPERWLAVAAAMERHSRHPLARAVVRHAEEAGVDVHRPVVESFRSVSGQGIRALVDGTSCFLGRPDWIGKQVQGGLPPEAERLVSDAGAAGRTVVLLATDREVVALFGLSDRVREGAGEMVQRLNRLGVRQTVMLTGDGETVARAVAEETGIPEVHAGLLPDEKLTWIRRLGRSGKVAMVGDGVNDAPALAAADVGIAMGGVGSDAALETADVVIMGDDPGKVPLLIRIGRKTVAVIRQNIAVALGLKLAALLLIIPGMLTLWMAVFADMGATLLVTLNALRLLGVKE
ncbi:heavy metal translocating P-type ATPase [Staphylospora marina]|uniref:heavy metal translocating P-type ATPase n=1 Tax=Staphylospora marina TaxID=2490858 RepID=UPI000F5C1443|nr:heavy metal translocating P-type ATPase [Staphylospora marina]